MSNTQEAELLPRWIAANGLEFGYLEAGQGPLVLCLHGFPDSAWTFASLLRVLAGAGFRAVAPFQRGYAPSEIPADGDYRATTLARDAIALADHFGAARFSLVGHDWGAMAAYIAATQRPDRVARIVTAAVPHPRRFLLRPTFAQLWRSRYMGFFQLRGIAERRVRANHCAWIDGLVREWSPGWRFSEADLAPVKANLLELARLRAALGYYRALPSELSRGETWKLLSQPVGAPARVIYGVDDGCIGAEMFSGMEHLFAAGVDVVAMQGAGHFMQREQPEVFNRLVLEFLRTT